MPISIEKHINPRQYFPDAKYIIDYAFSLGEHHYFKFNDAFNIPAKRALATMTFYRELELNIDNAHLNAHSEAQINCLTPTQERPSIEVGEALLLARQLKARVNGPKDTDLMYKLAAVVYFDQNENPNVFEYQYGHDKVRKWRREVEMEDFFLSKPLKELIPYLQYAAENLKAFDLLAEQLKRTHSESIQANLSSEQLTTLNESAGWYARGN